MATLRVLSDEGWGRPTGVAVNQEEGLLYIADESAGVVRRVDASGNTHNVAKGVKRPQGIAYCSGRVAVCESGLGRVAAIDAVTGAVEVLWPGLLIPTGVAASETELFVCSAGSHAVFARDMRCKDDVRVVAGTPGTCGNMKHDSCGDGGPATSAQLFSPSDIALASNCKDLYIADSYNGRVRVVENGILRTVAGADQSMPRGSGGPATQINIGVPRSVAWAPDGPFIAASPAIIWQLSGGEMLPIAGTWEDGDNGDEGPALERRLNNPAGLALWNSQLVISDTDNRRICVVDLCTA